MSPEAMVQSGAGWEAFCEALKPLARHIVGDGAPEANLVTRTEGMRCLSRLLALGLDRFLEYGDPTHPDFYDLQTATRKYLGDNPDQTYRVAPLDGTGHYVVRGTAANSAAVEFGVYAGTFQTGGGGRRLVASLDESNLVRAEDGGFEVTLSPEQGQDNHLRLEPDANSLLIRTYFWDRELRRTHLMPRIERTDVTGPEPLLTPEALMRGLLGAVAFVDGSLDWWNKFDAMRGPANTMFPLPDDGTVQTPSQVRYVNGWIELETDQALVLEFTPKDEPTYWSLVMQNSWGETSDWRYRPTGRNNREIQKDAQGRVRVIISSRDPGVVNWMDMAGHRKMLIALRWRGSSPLPTVDTRVVALSGLLDA